MKNNNKGFIATSVLFGIVALLFITIAIILGNSQASLKNTKIYGSILKSEISSFLGIRLHPMGGTLDKTTLEIDFNGTYGGTEGVLPKPKRAGYSFVGWYTEKIDGQLVEANTKYQDKPTMDLYAYWSSDLFRLTIDTNGGTYNDFSGVLDLRCDEIIILPIPERIGYVFNGWEIVSGDGIKINGSELKMGYTHAEIKAVWKRANAQLTVDLNGGIWEYVEGKYITELATFDLKYGDTMDIPDPIKEGYMFSGWTLEGVELNGTTATIKSENAKMTANWKILDNIKYGVRHHQQAIDGDEYTLIDADTTYGLGTYNTEVEVFANSYRGFLVNGEIIENENGDKIVSNKQTIIIKADESNNFADFYYNRLMYKITIDPNGGTYDGESEKTYRYGKTIDLETEFSKPVRTGYNFVNWEVSSGVINANTYTIDAENVTLKAIWEARKYILTLNPNGGNISNASVEVTYDSPYGNLETPVRTGYTFRGWSLTADGSNMINSNTIVKTAEDHTLYAVWEPNQYTVTLHLRGGAIGNATGTTTITVTYGSPYNLPTPTKNKHDFYGWYTEETAISKVLSTDIVSTASNHNLYAIWIPKDAEFIQYSNSTYTTCTTVACALDELYEKFK